MRRAFVMGSNGPTDGRVSPLRYALQDAERMRACLAGARCGFEVTMPEPGADVFEVRRKLTFVTDSCTPDDTFVCYFSGHGALAPEGGLFLLWDNTNLGRLMSTALPISNIMEALKFCKARSRLLILDCCHAGAVASMHGFKDAADVPVQELEIRPDNYSVLMASAHLERARELETLQGSFLTTYIALALEEKFTAADKDNDGRLSVQELYQWVEERAKIHNRLNPETRVSSPYLFGKQQGEFYLTLAASAWVPYELDWPDGSTMVVLPIHSMIMRRLRSAYDFGPVEALCIGKYPITNAQYRRFIEKVGRGREPVGEHYMIQPEVTTQHAASKQKGVGSWQGPFYPWQNEEFRDPEKPIVCVSYYDAEAYCHWVNDLNTRAKASTSLPDPRTWDIAAFGTAFPSYDPITMFTQNQIIHHNSSGPAPIDRTGARSNALGISDLLGNVWEWCLREEDVEFARLGPSEPEIELRGGGFMDDLSKVKPALLEYSLKDRADTRHSDLGFRIAVRIPIEDLPEEVRQRLLTTSERSLLFVE